MKSLLRSAAKASAAVAVMLCAQAALAGTVFFSFDGPDQAFAGTDTETSGAYSLLANGYFSTGGGAFVGTRMSRANNALGVASPNDNNPGQIDNSGATVEAILFDFGSLDFASLDIAFSLLGNSDAMDIWYGDSLTLSSATSPLEHHLANPVIGGSAPVNPFSLTNFDGARYLMIAAVDNGTSPSACGLNSGNACFRIASINAVPEPGALALVGVALLAGLAGSRGLRRTSALLPA